MVCVASIASLDLHADAAQLGKVRGVDRQAHRFAVDDGVERAAEGDVGTNLPRAELHRQAAVQHEGRHVHERHALDARRLPPLVPRRPRAARRAESRARPDRSGGRVVDDRSCRRRPASAARARARSS